MSSPALAPLPEATQGAVLPQLAAIRSELDRVDDVLHDALMRRADLVAEVARLRSKGKVPLRPGREAAIIRRLLARNRGALDPALLVRIWREMISGFSVQQQAMRVVVDDAALLPIAGAHFGLLTPAETVGSAAAAMACVAAGEATTAVLRWPGAWWTALLDGRAATLSVVARLPFWGSAAGVDAMVLTEAPPDPSGDDRTLVATALPPGELPASLPARALAGDPAGPSLFELEGFVAQEEPLLARLPGRFRVLGAYATPIGVSR